MTNISHSGNLFLLNGNIESSDSLWPSINKEKELYDVFRVEQGVALFLEDHLERLYKGAQDLHLHIQYKPQALLNQLKQYIKASHIGTGNIRLSLLFSPGSSEVHTYMARFIEHHYPEESLYQTGVRCSLINDERNQPTLKIANPALRNRSDQVLRQERLFETILVNKEGKITEGSRSNIFFIRDNALYTAPDQLVLGGVIRKKVIAACCQLKLPIYFEAIDVKKGLPQMDASFITGTSPRVLPIKQIDKQLFNASHPILKMIMDLVQEQVNQYIKEAIV